MLWFTVQRGNSVGRLDPQNGLIVLKNVPTAHALPYGIAVNSKGVPYFCEFGTNKLASINPATMEITEYPLPAGARPRRLAITPDDMVYYSDYERGYLGRLGPTTGKTEEWRSWPVFRNLFAVGTSEIFGSGIMRQVARWIRVVVVDPEANLIPAMRAGAFGLRRARILILYPEGERSIDGKPKVFKKGAAILSIHLQVPIVPVAIEGFYEAWPRSRPFQKFAPLKMVFGDPISPPPESEASEAAYDRLTAELTGRVVGMWEELREAASPAKAAD